MGAALFAQQISYSLADKFSYRDDDIDILGKYADTYLVHYQEGKDHKISAYYPNLGLKWNKYVKLPTKKWEVDQFMLNNGNLLMFSTGRTKTGKILYGRVYNHHFDTITTLFTLDTIRKNFAESYPTLKYLESEDKSKILVYFINENLGKHDEFHFLLLDKDLNIIIKKNIDIPLTNKNVDIYDVLLANNGQIYLILSEYKTLGLSSALRYWLLSSSADFDQLDRVELKPDDGKYLNNVLFKIDNRNGNIVAAGFYADDAIHSSNAEGIFYNVFNMSNPSESFIRFEAFTPEFIARVKGNRKVRTNDRLYTFVIDDIILRQDGGALIIAESFYKTLRNSADLFDPYNYNAVNDINITYHYEDLLIVSVMPNGEIHWKNVLPKNQTSIGDLGRYASYSKVNTGTSIEFIYNDEVDFRTNVIQYSVEPDGESNRQLILNSYKNDVYLMPQWGKQVDYNEIIIPSLRRKDLRLVKLSY